MNLNLLTSLSFYLLLLLPPRQSCNVAFFNVTSIGEAAGVTTMREVASMVPTSMNTGVTCTIFDTLVAATLVVVTLAATTLVATMLVVSEILLVTVVACVSCWCEGL